MSNYPNSLPSFSTLVDGSDIVKAADISVANREIEAIRMAIGDNPVKLNDSISPTSPPPTNINQYLSMLGNIVKTMTGAVNWYNANVPLRSMFFLNGLAQTVPGASTYYAGAFSYGLSATENLMRCPLPYAGTLTQIKLFTLSTQPAVLGMVVTWEKNGADTAATLTVPGGAVSGRFSGPVSISYAIGDTLSIKLANANALASAQIGAIGFEFDQAG